MDRRGWLFVRVAAAVAGAIVLLAGTVFALQGGDSPATPGGPDAILPQVTISPYTPTPEASIPPAATTTAAATLRAEPPAATTPDLATTTAVAPARPISQPPTATPAPATATTPAATDIPIYKDTQVLAMAAAVVLPSGKTFEQCVALGPNGARWPVPVHLYYEGQGKWLVETHLGEIETEFDEATATFRVKHFAPEANECR